MIHRAQFPPSVMAKLERAHAELHGSGLAAVDQGLREWLICCAHGDGRQLGMPSRAVDWAWHELILHTPAYHALCREAFGTYLHHTPESDLRLSMRAALHETVRAWDRSEAGRAGREPSLWELDERLGIVDPIGVAAAARRSARADASPRRRGSDGRRGAVDHHAWLPLSGIHGGGDGGGCGGGGCGGGG